MVAPTTEKLWQSQVETLAQTLGWRTYHTWNSMRSTKGYPDLFAVRRDRIVIAELKIDSPRSKTTPEQDEWLHDLAVVAEAVGRDHLDVYVWRPSEIDDVKRVLR